jgi:hypothetical protein
MSEPQVAQIGIAQTEMFRFAVSMTSQRKSLCYQTRGKLSCLPDSNLPRLCGRGIPPANRGPVRRSPTRRSTILVLEVSCAMRICPTTRKGAFP